MFKRGFLFATSCFQLRLKKAGNIYQSIMSLTDKAYEYWHRLWVFWSFSQSSVNSFIQLQRIEASFIASFRYIHNPWILLQRPNYLCIRQAKKKEVICLVHYKPLSKTTFLTNSRHLILLGHLLLHCMKGPTDKSDIWAIAERLYSIVSQSDLSINDQKSLNRGLSHRTTPESALLVLTKGKGYLGTTLTIFVLNVTSLN